MVDTEGLAAPHLVQGTLSREECRRELMMGFRRLTIRVALDPVLVRSLEHHDDPVLNLEALILRANLEVLYSSARNTMKLLDLAAASPPEIRAQVRPHFAWLAKHSLAHALDEIGRSGDSMEAAVEASAIATEAGHLRLAAMSRSMFGQALSRQGYSADAALTLAEASQAPLVEEGKGGLSEYYLARIYERESDIEGAVRQLIKAANSPIAHLAFDGYQIELARLLGKAGRIEEASSALAAGRTILRRRGEPAKVRNRYLLASAQICIAKGDFTRAARLAEWSKEGFERGGFAIIEQSARLVLAKAQLGLGDPTSAIATLDAANPAIAGPFARLETAQILSECYIALDDHRNAVQQLQEAAQQSEQLCRSAQAVAEMERVVAERTKERLRAVLAEAERDELKVRHLHNSEAISMVCHDLRGSLSIVALAAESLAGSTTGPKLKERLFDSIDSMDHVVTQLNSVTELDQTMRRLANESVEVNDLCSSIVARLLPLAATRSIALSVSEQDLKLSVDGDTTAVERILINFITNALSHCPSGTNVSVRFANVDPSTVRIAVVDDGPGIEGNDMATVFQKFVSGDDRSDSASTGLGLYIARQLAYSMNGDVGVEPGDSGLGCCFWLELPATRVG